jgi:hypothetical protein
MVDSSFIIVLHKVISKLTRYETPINQYLACCFDFSLYSVIQRALDEF